MIHKGKVITNFGGSIVIKLDNNDKVNATLRSHLKGELTVGDNVELLFDNNTYVITKLFERKNLISRPNMYQRKNKNIAANIDQAAVIFTHSPAPIEHYIDRYLAAFHNSDIEPLIIINKIDSQSPEDEKHITQLEIRYKKIGYTVCNISAISRVGIDNLNKELENKTSIFLGQSGVGKSETLNAILGRQITPTNIVSESTKKGKHTTTCSTLYEINDNTSIIDSPGIREFGLWNIYQTELFNGFIDFKQFRGMCQFRNCTHELNSKGCEIVKQMNEGNIDPLRFKNYHRILAEITTK